MSDKPVVADIDHVLAVASIISPTLVHHMIAKLYQDEHGRVLATDVYKLDELFGERCGM